MGFGKYVPLFEEFYNEKKDEIQSQSQAQDTTQPQEVSQTQGQEEGKGSQEAQNKKSSQPNSQEEEEERTRQEKADEIVKNGGSIDANVHTREQIVKLWRDEDDLKKYDNANQITLENFEKKCNDSNNIICILTSSRPDKGEKKVLKENEIIRSGLLAFPGAEVYNCIGGYQGILESSLIAVYSGEQKTLFSMCCFNYGAKYEQDSIMIKCDDGVFHFVTSNKPASKDNIVGDFTVSEIRKIEDNEKLGEYFTIVDGGKTAFAIE